MNRDFIVRTRNARLKEDLLQRENIPVLEDILKARREEAIELYYDNYDEDRSAELDREGVESLFDDVKTRVDKFLGVEGVSRPKIWMPTQRHLAMMQYAVATVTLPLMLQGAFMLGVEQQVVAGTFMMSSAHGCGQIVSNSVHERQLGAYHPLVKRVILGPVEKRTAANTVATLIHEYTHHVQRETGIFRLRNRSFDEGMAIGVERHVTRELAQEMGQSIYLSQVVDIDRWQLSQAYLFLCDRFDLQPREDLVRYETELPRRLGAHATGNAVVSLMEVRDGVGVYRKMINGEYDWK